MRFYYRATSDMVQSIMSDGFADNIAQDINVTELAGIWLTDMLFNVNEDLSDMKVLAIDIDLSEEEMAKYEVTVDSIPYREYLFPVELIKDKGSLQVMKDKAEKETAYYDYVDSMLAEKINCNKN
ncbi:hypothetical protein Dtox_2821 [Desulfofarcimen acetoxidans DSM 771]|uniref:Uncharacterized protein n=1 Tax=Desulfofarcimen acetoxidans (strain ATCC 49208 / DSM 771 / KCTC 5769 / VKM B-1644 / 5575) TaxID=485916 RepID=C8W1W5_DESAS|nr:hypothetical protein [Desulfofarcimen acetoxidans]ACV63586.1 hypothetical protein Dtox_2821 [Desulfofarcimen acetoxidans DSM 771]